jgi:diaminohydroxyphosphoribosylaminopyrimidine deaminase/5-amino-6-(5-phosphoribosylamino)uracil reductase
MDEIKGMHLSIEDAMKIAISEAYKGAPYVSPNPLVGCVVLDSKGNFLKSGYHKFYGGPHAEVDAVEGLSASELRGAHVIVTLEPCAHEGKTPSCAKMLAKLPIKKVTYGLVDPNPLVAGQGAQILREAGKDVYEFNGPKTELEEVCEAFLLNFREKKVFTAIKVATSLDGQMALNSGESQWITSEASRETAHYLRACYDATLVGAGTVAADNPSLNVRHPGIKKENKVVVLDPKGDLLSKYSSLNISSAHPSENVFWCVSESAKTPSVSAGPRILNIKMKDQEFDFEDLNLQLWSSGLRSMMVEGGSYTISQFIKTQRAQRLYLFMAPHLMGAGGSISWTKFLEIHAMKERIAIKNLHTEVIGQELLLTGKF